MNKTRLMAGALALLATPAALAGTVAGTPTGGPLGFTVGDHLGAQLGQLVGDRVGEFLPVAVPGLLAIAGGALALGIYIIRRKRGR